MSINQSTYICAPNTSILFDGNVAIAGLDGDMWAERLVTFQSNRFQLTLTFNFTESSTNYTGIEGVELVMFNCPEWGIAVQSIVITGATSASSCSSLLGVVNPSITSCDSLVRVCIPLNTTLPVLGLQFFPHADTNWVHLAEVTFLSVSTSVCPQPVPDSTSSMSLPLTTIAGTPHVNSKLVGLWGSSPFSSNIKGGVTSLVRRVE